MPVRSEHTKKSLSHFLSPLQAAASVAVLSLFFTSGCAFDGMKSAKSEQTESESPAVKISQKAAKPSQTVAKAEDKKVEEIEEELPPFNMLAANYLNSEQMFEILKAELLLARNNKKEAFNTFYELTQEVRRPELAEHTFKLSMATYDIEAIAKATELWRDIQPDNASPWRASILLYLRDDKLELSIKAFEKFEQLSEGSFEEDLFTVISRLASTLPEAKSKPFIDALAQTYSDRWSVFFSQAKLSMAHGRFEEALTQFKQAYELSPQEFKNQSLTSIAEIYIRLQQPEQGLEYLVPKADEFAQEAGLLESVARLYVQLEKYDEAADLYNQVVKIAPENNSAKLSLALIQIERKDYQAAIENLQPIENDGSYGLIAKYYLGVALQEQDKHSEALEYFKKVDRSNYRTDAALRSAEILFNQDKKQEAYAVLDSFKPKDIKDQVKFLRARAIFNVMEDKISEGADAYREALKLDAKNVDLMLSLAQLLFELEKFDEYEDVLSLAISIDPDNADGLNALGYYYLEKGVNIDKAGVMLKRALNVAPNSFYIMDSLGWYFYLKGDYAAAIDLLKQAFDLETDPEVFAHLVQAYWKNNQPDMARELWEAHASEFSGKDIIEGLMEKLESGSL